MTAPRKAAYLLLSLGLVASLVAVLVARPSHRPGPADTTHVARRPVLRSGLDEAPTDVREFLGRVLEAVADHGAGVAGFQFKSWERPGKPTREALGLKAFADVDPEALIARVMDVDGYEGRIAHVAACRSARDPAFVPPQKVRFFQKIRVPRVADIQHELVLVDAGTIQGYRVAYWYLLADETASLDRKDGARSEFNVGAWLAAPGAVGYAVSSWPRRGDVNAVQWWSLTSGANALAKSIVEGNIDGMAAWAAAPPPPPADLATARSRERATPQPDR